jgi:histidinol-phosphatase (PHP family)
VLAEYGIPITVGSDAHQPEEIGERHPHIERYLDARGLEAVELSL